MLSYGENTGWPISGHCRGQISGAGAAGNRVRFDCTEVEYRDFWRHYFDIETDYGAVMAQINPNDTYLTAAAQLAWGVRILNQDLWEMIVTFLISSKIISSEFAAVLRISVRPMERQRQRRMVSVYYAFPDSPGTCGLEKDALMACNLGLEVNMWSVPPKLYLPVKWTWHEISSFGITESKGGTFKTLGVGEKSGRLYLSFCLHIWMHFRWIPISVR